MSVCLCCFTESEFLVDFRTWRHAWSQTSAHFLSHDGSPANDTHHNSTIS